MVDGSRPNAAASAPRRCGPSSASWHMIPYAERSSVTSPRCVDRWMRTLFRSSTVSCRSIFVSSVFTAPAFRRSPGFVSMQRSVLRIGCRNLPLSLYGASDPDGVAPPLTENGQVHERQPAPGAPPTPLAPAKVGGQMPQHGVEDVDVVVDPELVRHGEEKGVRGGDGLVL